VVSDPREDVATIVWDGIRQFAPKGLTARSTTGVLPTPRWATAGPFLSLHLGGGRGGLRHLLEHLGPGMARRWRDLGHPDLDQDTVDRLADEAERAFGTHRYQQLTENRDRQEIAVLAARSRARRHAT